MCIRDRLGLTEKEKSQILSINMANNPSRLYKEVWIGLGGDVYKRQNQYTFMTTKIILTARRKSMIFANALKSSSCCDIHLFFDC